MDDFIAHTRAAPATRTGRAASAIAKALWWLMAEVARSRLTTSVESPACGKQVISEDVSGLTVHPNSGTGLFTLSFILEKEEMSTIVLYNILGQAMGTLMEDRLNAGLHRIPVSLDPKTLPGGMYLIRLSTPTFTRTSVIGLVK